MSKKETPLTRRYWREVGGTLIEEFPAVKASPDNGKRFLDAVIVINGENKIAKFNEISIKGKDIIVVQTKAKRLGMYLMGQAIISPKLLRKFKPRSIKSVAICIKGDSVLEPILKQYNNIELVVYED